jgi:hypothetical protein
MSTNDKIRLETSQGIGIDGNPHVVINCEGSSINYLTVVKAREIAAELIRLADEIEVKGGAQ